MKSKVLQRPMFMSPDEVENVGIMQGFMDDMEDVFAEDEEDDSDEADAARMMGRTPDSPEILMNNLRGDVRSVDARVEELADMVGYRAASETPMEVLALLQPVLAGQGEGQGIAALPMGGAPGQAMPPMPDALPAMPPEAQAAGAPPAMPAGGIASLPQGDTMPLQMAKGGIVQHFQEGGSAEDTATLPMAVSSLTTTSRNPDLARAQDEMLRFLEQRPVDIPNLQSSMEERIPVYQSLLGTENKDSMRASMLFDIAQAALGYAGNVGPQGQPLRGSQAARLAGAVSALPGQIGTRLAAQQEQNQAVRLMAIQSAEKDIQAARESNASLLKEQRNMLRDYAKSTTERQDLLFGTGGEGRAAAIGTALASKYGAGETTPAETSLFETAMWILQQPKPITDPVTQQTVFMTTPLPPEFTEAINAQGRIGINTSNTTGPVTGPDEQALPVLERNVLTVQPRSENYFEANMPSLFNAADKGTGPLPTFNTFLFRTPILNAMAPELAGTNTEARTYLNAVANSLTTAFRADTEDPTFAESERRELASAINAASSVIDQPEAYKRRLFALDDRLISLQQSALRRYRAEGIPADQKRAAIQQLNALHELRALVGAPLNISSISDPRGDDIIRRYPVNTVFYIRSGPDGNTIPQTITEEMKAQLNSGEQ
jgi:hypothetical protein